MGAVETVVDAVTDNRTYYKCPSCKQEVWAYGSFVGQYADMIAKFHFSEQ